MAKRADLAVYGPDGTLQLVVEVKNKPGPALEWAIQMRRNLLAHSLLPNSPYFLLALPDSFYLWKDGSPISYQSPPDYAIDAAEVLRPYLPPSIQSLETISEPGLELLVTAWLQDLLNTRLEREKVAPALRPLFDSGLYDAIRNGSVAIEAIT
jgi:hypothetical protein